MYCFLWTHQQFALTSKAPIQKLQIKWPNRNMSESIFLLQHRQFYFCLGVGRGAKMMNMWQASFRVTAFSKEKRDTCSSPTHPSPSNPPSQGHGRSRAEQSPWGAGALKSVSSIESLQLCTKKFIKFSTFVKIPCNCFASFVNLLSYF